MNDSGERLRNALRAAGRRFTPQRRLILEVRVVDTHLHVRGYCAQCMDSAD